MVENTEMLKGIDIQSERILVAVIDALFEDADDDCPKAKAAYQMLERIREANNLEIMEQIGYVVMRPCPPRCPHYRAP